MASDLSNEDIDQKIDILLEELKRVSKANTEIFSKWIKKDNIEENRTKEKKTNLNNSNNSNNSFIEITTADFNQDEKKTNRIRYLAEIEAQLGHLYNIKENYSKSLQYFLAARADYSNIVPNNDDLKTIASLNGAIGSIYLSLGENSIAKKFLEEALQYWEKHMFLNELVATLQNLALIELQQDHEVEAVDYILRALKIAMKVQDEDQFILSLEILLQHFEKKKDYEMLEELKIKALEFWQQMGLLDRIFKTSIDLGVISQIRDKYNQAIIHFKRAYNTAYKLKDAEKMYLANGFIAESFFKSRDIEKARKIYYDTLKLAVYINKNKNFENEIEQMKTVLAILGEDPHELSHFIERIKKEISRELNEKKT